MICRRLKVEVAGRLIRDEHLWLPDHGSRHRNPLLLPAGQLVRKCRAAIPKTDRLERVERAVPGLLVPDTQVSDLERKGDVFDRCQPRQKLVVLEDHANASSQLRDPRRLDRVRGDAVHPDLALGRCTLRLISQRGAPAAAAEPTRKVISGSRDRWTSSSASLSHMLEPGRSSRMERTTTWTNGKSAG
jgi:hypothetical protein